MDEQDLSHPPLGPPGHAARGPLQVLRRVGGLLLDQASMHGQLLTQELEQEKQRLLRSVFLILLGFGCVLCLMLVGGALLLVLTWSTPYRVAAMLTVPTAYALGAAITWRRLQALAQDGTGSFAAVREELAADVALLRRRDHDARP